jgi:hypothetical protein
MPGACGEYRLKRRLSYFHFASSLDLVFGISARAHAFFRPRSDIPNRTEFSNDWDRVMLGSTLRAFAGSIQTCCIVVLDLRNLKMLPLQLRFRIGTVNLWRYFRAALQMKPGAQRRMHSIYVSLSLSLVDSVPPSKFLKPHLSSKIRGRDGYSLGHLRQMLRLHLRK